MTTRTRKAPSATPAKKTATKKATSPRPPRNTTAKKTTPTPRLSLVKPTPSLPTRDDDWMTDTQGFATLAARIAGIPTVRIRDWRDHRNGTATRPLHDGSHLHYDLPTRTLTWQAICPMGATHEYVLDTPSVSAAARVHADRCTKPHANFDHIPPFTTEELAELGIHQGPTWARPDLLGDEITETIPVTLPAKPRAIADQLAHSTTSTTDTQPLSQAEIADGLTARVDLDQMKEHPQP